MQGDRALDLSINAVVGLEDIGQDGLGGAGDRHIDQVQGDLFIITGEIVLQAAVLDAVVLGADQLIVAGADGAGELLAAALARGQLDRGLPGRGLDDRPGVAGDETLAQRGFWVKQLC